jgi:heme-degrading monooxygenase HmoA
MQGIRDAPDRRVCLARQAVTVILEHAVLDVVPGQEADFEGAFREAQGIIASMPGFCSLRLDRCVESPSRYMLLVEWERLKDHTEGFRRSPDYDRWRTLLHHFYRPFPVVEHYHPVVEISGGPREPHLPRE